MEVGGGQNEYALMEVLRPSELRLQRQIPRGGERPLRRHVALQRGHRWGFFLIARMAHLKAFSRQTSQPQNQVFVRTAGNQNVGYYDYIRKISIGNQNYLFGGDKPDGHHFGPVASNLGKPDPTAIRRRHELPEPAGFQRRLLHPRYEGHADRRRRTAERLRRRFAQMNSADLRPRLRARSAGAMSSAPAPAFTYSVTVTFNDYVTNITKYDNPDRTFAKSYYEGMRWGEIWGYRTRTRHGRRAAGYAVDQTAVNNRINAAAGSNARPAPAT
ncbi:MAG: hypothetical protein ACLRMJ_08455 [Alistipes finegoldii]